MISLLFIHEMGYGLGIAKKRKRKGYNSSSLRHLQTMVDLVGLATDAVFAFANRPLVANLFPFACISYCDYIKGLRTRRSRHIVIRICGPTHSLL